MTFQEAMQTLEASGTEQTRKTYAKHGVKNELFGVSYGNLGKLTKKIKQDHALALELWQRQNHDAMILTTMIANPKELGPEIAELWSQDLDNYVITDAFTALMSKTAFMQEKMQAWMHAEEEFVGQTGWALLGYLAGMNKTLPDSYFEPYLEEIETSIHEQKNRVKHSMNQALIGIGVRSPQLEKCANEVAKAIGNLNVDHGETNCKTPDAASYIKKTVNRRGFVLVSA